MFHSSSKGIQPIIPGLMNTQGVNVPLVTFDSIMDTDFGLLLYIDRNFLDPDIFDVDFFNSHHTIKAMAKALIEREQKNPLSICIKEEVETDMIDQLYNEFVADQSHYEKILKLSLYTNLYEFINLAQHSGGEVKPTIVCQHELEKVFIKKNISKDVPVLMLDKANKVDYQQFFFKYIDGEYVNKLIERIELDRSIYLANYKFNVMENIKDSLFFEVITRKYSRISMYDPYERELFTEE